LDAELSWIWPFELSLGLSNNDESWIRGRLWSSKRANPSATPSNETHWINIIDSDRCSDASSQIPKTTRPFEFPQTSVNITHHLSPFQQTSLEINQE
jgi:hypothetical protein